VRRRDDCLRGDYFNGQLCCATIESGDNQEKSMSIFRLNHAVLYVRDITESVAFYRDVLGFDYITGGDSFPGAAFLRAPGSTNDHDLGLFQIGSQAAASGAGRSTVGLYHLAWEVDTLGDLEDLAAKLAEANALVGASDHGTTKSLYAKDPNGLEFEVVWIIPADRLTDDDRTNTKSIRPLDLQREISRYGRDVRGGVGISRPSENSASLGV
jgi:catechol-2,3-dioxygenase